MNQTPYNQLPPLRQPLSDSSLHLNDPGSLPASASTSVNGAARLDSLPNSASSTHVSPRIPYQPNPNLTLPLPGLVSVADHGAAGSQPRFAAIETASGSQHIHSTYYPSPRESSPHTSRTTSSSSRAEMMYPNYSQQYSAHQIPSNAQYGGTIPQQPPGRMLPSAHSSMLPPVYPQTNYAAPSLPGPMPYDNSGAQQILTPASTTHTLTSSNSANLGPEANFIGTRGNFKYELRIEQQPQRARMCGFGDKDRRPITPPPCVRLIVRRADTGEEVDVDKYDGAYFVLQVDLWDQDAVRDVNIIRAASSAPSQSISTAVQMGYPPPASPMYVDGYQINPFGMPNYAMAQQMQQPSNSHILYTRNLIGSLTVNASLLKDTDGVAAYWFVLSDLSVRTEGWFRLRMTFIDVGERTASGDMQLNRGKCAVLASVFSDKFQVYSAKKFPGVIESTPLSKCFAHQGIKIPIRKDGKGDKNEDDDGI